MLPSTHPVASFPGRARVRSTKFANYFRTAGDERLGTRLRIQHRGASLDSFPGLTASASAVIESLRINEARPRTDAFRSGFTKSRTESPDLQNPERKVWVEEEKPT